MTDELDTTRPFSRASALAAGLPDSTLRGPGYRRLFTGVYVAADTPPTARQRVAGALVPFRGRAFASHLSAARVLGVPVPDDPDEHVTVVERSRRRAVRGVVTHSVRSARTITVEGIPVSAPEQLFVELATLLPLVDLVVAGDHLVRHGHTSVDRLRAYAARRSVRGARHARRAAAYVRARVRSPMETRLRMLLVLAGLPEPGINVLVGSPGGPMREHDLLYQASRTAVEFDGRQHAESVEQWQVDLQRREDIDDDGYRILVVTAAGIYREPGRTLERVARLLRSRGEPGVPAVLRDEWRSHFPGR